MRLLTVLLLAFLVLSLQLAAAPITASGSPEPPAGPSLSPDLPASGSMECPSRVTQAGIQGSVPAGWTGVVLSTGSAPDIENGRYYWSSESPQSRSCDPNIWVEHLEGNDDWTFMSADWKTPPIPGKPFDAALYQKIGGVTPGKAYSLSAWMISLCGGSDPRGYCPTDYWIAKMIGIDPTGGTNPLSSSVEWIENRTPHQINGKAMGWQNLRMAATAQGSTLTVFARVNSPFQWAANQAFLDAVKLVEAPTASFVNLPHEVQGRHITVTWTGDMGPDIPAIDKGNYQLYFDLEYRIEGSAAGWQPWFTAQGAASQVFGACSVSLNPVVYLRIRPRAEQPPCPPGEKCDWARPNHRFPGVWTESGPIQVRADSPCLPVAFLPMNQ